MEESLVKLGLGVYQVAGLMGVLIVVVATLVVLLLRSYTKQLKLRNDEIQKAKDQIEEIRKDVSEKLSKNLNDCVNECAKKDIELSDLRQKVAVHQRNETWFRNEIENLNDKVQELEANYDIRAGRSKRKTRRRAQPDGIS